MDLTKLEEKTGYAFRNRELLETALTHSSYANEFSRRKGEIGFNERLEFLGDAVLELVTSEFIFETHSDMPEGSMSKLRASLVCEPSLAYCARDIGLGEYLRLGRGEDMTGGRNRDSILSDAFEAVIGAIYLDGGLQEAGKFVRNMALAKLDDARLFKDSKTYLQEITQNEFRCMPEYILIGEEGPAHMKTFTVELRIAGKKFAVGSGTSKKGAEQEAARKAIRILTERSGNNVSEKH
ncbi:MAG: ribonuclease III [Lachnospiraceae bacterium]|jgi:ribonuclease-3|nr:ribonuclease III [Lachnospiraceae bacterium]MBR6999725.1 ribonuclease III [Lachnospiraceae bacterium]MCR5531015.1 ribonuclease III [Lachnospiraceae bacterium]